MGNCKHPTCGETCRRVKAEKKTQKIKPRSAKRKNQFVEYLALMADFLKSKSRCEINAPGCTYYATVIHHTQGRENSRLTDVEKWLASCVYCNGYVEDHDAWARENNFKLDKHGKYERPK